MKEVFDAVLIADESESLVDEESCDCPGPHGESLRPGHHSKVALFCFIRIQEPAGAQLLIRDDVVSQMRHQPSLGHRGLSLSGHYGEIEIRHIVRIKEAARLLLLDRVGRAALVTENPLWRGAALAGSSHDAGVLA